MADNEMLPADAGIGSNNPDALQRASSEKSKPGTATDSDRYPTYDEMLDMDPAELERHIAAACEAKGIVTIPASSPRGGITGYLKE